MTAPRRVATNQRPGGFDVRAVLCTRRPCCPRVGLLDAYGGTLSIHQRTLWLLPDHAVDHVDTMLSRLLSIAGTLARNELDVRETPRGRFSRCLCSTRFTRNGS